MVRLGGPVTGEVLMFNRGEAKSADQALLKARLRAVSPHISAVVRLGYP